MDTRNQLTKYNYNVLQDTDVIPYGHTVVVPTNSEANRFFKYSLASAIVKHQVDSIGFRATGSINPYVETTNTIVKAGLEISVGVDFGIKFK